MRIAYYTDSFFPHLDGVTTYVGVITRSLIAMGHEVMVVAPRWKGVSLQSVQKFVPGARLVLVPGVTPFFFPDMKLGTLNRKSMKEVSDFKPDILHFHSPGLMGFEATALAKLMKVPLVTTFHTYYMEPEVLAVMGLKENGKISKILQESLWKISEKIHNPCDAVIAPTQYVGKDLQSRWKKAKVCVIPGAVELSSFHNHKFRNSLRKKYGLENSVVFLSVGRLSAEKNFSTLITAFSMILMKNPNAKLVFIGGGVARQELEYISKVLGISHAVVFIGEVPYLKLAKNNYYAMGDVFVTPSTWDTQGLSVVEAMAAGLPVVAFNYRAMPEVVGKAGLLAKHQDQYGFAQAMSKLAGSAKLRKQLGEQAVQQSNTYNIQSHIEAILNLYAELISRNQIEN
jgi:glycosyltransferase involved in cell wall biosynthesis